MGIIIGVSLAGGSGRPVLGTSAARVLRAGFADLHPEAEPEERCGVNCNLALDGGSNRTLVTEEYGKKMGFRKLDGRAMWSQLQPGIGWRQQPDPGDWQ